MEIDVIGFADVLYVDDEGEGGDRADAHVVCHESEVDGGGVY